MKTLLISLLGLACTLNATVDAQKLLEDKCSSCHMLSSSTKVKKEKISAPPMWGIMKKVSEKFPKKEDGIAFIIDYVNYPSEEKMIFPVQTKEYFGLMPSLKKEMSEEELKAIAEYLYKDL